MESEPENPARSVSRRWNGMEEERNVKQMLSQVKAVSVAVVVVVVTTGTAALP
jgi:hypothetical protein